jgi:hypothetical protein
MSARKVVIIIPLDDPALLTLDQEDNELYGDGDAVGAILHEVADSWEGMQLVPSCCELRLADDTVVGTIEITESTDA